MPRRFARAFRRRDPDIVFSEDSAVVSSELALSYALTDTLSARTSLRNTHDSDPLEGREEFDRALNVSLVAAF